MDRVAPKAHLSVLICVLVADLVSLALLRWQLIRFRSKSKLFRQPQIWILILKCVLDSALVSLMVMDTSRGVDDGKPRPFRVLRMLSRLIDSFRRTVWARC